MKAKDKLRASWLKRDNDLGGRFPLGSQTKADAGFLLNALAPIVAELERRGYDKCTFKLSIEPQAGNARFASQRLHDREAPSHITTVTRLAEALPTNEDDERLVDDLMTARRKAEASDHD